MPAATAAVPTWLAAGQLELAFSSRRRLLAAAAASAASGQ